jgi:thymidylate kinase
MAIVPDLVLYLQIDVDNLIPRVFEGKGMDYWESGMHLALGSDLYDSFVRYQGELIGEYDRLAEEFSFVMVDARDSVDTIQEQLRAHVAAYLSRVQGGSGAGMTAPRGRRPTARARRRP